MPLTVTVNTIVECPRTDCNTYTGREKEEEEEEEFSSPWGTDDTVLHTW